jgi:phosphate-selective porin OprO and OprP
MKNHALRAILLATAAFALPAVAFAQQAPQEAEPPADAPSPDDASLQTVSDAEANASATDAKMALLQAQLEALQAQMDEMKKAQAKSTPAWKGAPLFADDSAGWSFKVRGRFMMDAAYMGKPDWGTGNAERAEIQRNLGFNTRVRRVRLGVEGTIPGDFGYKAEMDFANSSVGFGDVVLSWNPHKGPFTLTLGNQESLDGMEQITSSRWSSFIERAQVNDAFGNTRRLGLVASYRSKDNLLNAAVGAFASHSIDSSLNDKGWIGAARVSYAPYVGPGFVHIGASIQYRDFAENSTSGAVNNLLNNPSTSALAVGSPSAGQLVRYRARPFLQTVDVRFADTDTFAAKGDTIIGGELYGVFKSLHLGGEAQYVKTRAIKSGAVLSSLDAYTTPTQFAANGNPSFWGGHFEVGYFLTGETRGYKNGLWDRTKVLNPVDKGGMGAIQILGRVDYLDLSSKQLQRGCSDDFSNATICTPAALANRAKGGTQTGYLAGLTWIPVDYVRFLLNYIHTEVKDGPYAVASRVGKSEFSTDALALRAQFDF